VFPAGHAHPARRWHVIAHQRNPSGDELLAFTTTGEIVHTTVRQVIIHEVDEYVVVGTEQTTLRVTREHPFYTGNRTFKTLEALKVGDRIFCRGWRRSA